MSIVFGKQEIMEMIGLTITIVFHNFFYLSLTEEIWSNIYQEIKVTLVFEYLPSTVCVCFDINKLNLLLWCHLLPKSHICSSERNHRWKKLGWLRSSRQDVGLKMEHFPTLFRLFDILWLLPRITPKTINPFTCWIIPKRCHPVS